MPCLKAKRPRRTRVEFGLLEVGKLHALLLAVEEVASWCFWQPWGEGDDSLSGLLCKTLEKSIISQKPHDFWDKSDYGNSNQIPEQQPGGLRLGFFVFWE